MNPTGAPSCGTAPKRARQPGGACLHRQQRRPAPLPTQPEALAEALRMHRINGAHQPTCRVRRQDRLPACVDMPHREERRYQSGLAPQY